VGSIGSLVALSYRYRKAKQSSHYSPLKTSLPVSNYGATTPFDGDEHTPTQDNVSDGASDVTLHPYEEKSTRWSVYSWSRLMALAQAVIYGQALIDVYFGVYSLDTKVEGSMTSLLVMYAAQSFLWVRRLVWKR
jgi:hypothetical protein